MKILRVFAILLASLILYSNSTFAQAPRIYIRGGVKTHGPNEHDHPRFLKDWKELLHERGMVVDGGMGFPSAEQLGGTDVMVIYAADGMNIVGDERKLFEAFLKRGGGLTVIHDGVVSADQNDWCKQVIGGAWIWEDQRTKWLHGETGIYFVNDQHPVTKGISNFDWKDEIYYDLDMAADVNVLATSFHSVFVIAPQIWTYEKTWAGGEKPYRAFVSLPGHYYDVFNTLHYRAILMRGIAWAAHRSDVNEFCSPEEIGSLTYPEGGPIHPDQAHENFDLHPDFKVNLIASEPQISNVLSLDWAPDRSLWVLESPEYPNGRNINRNDDPIYPDRALNPSRYQSDKEDRPAIDRISRLEDTDQDGRFDKRHIFADFQHGVPSGLEKVTSFVFHKDGVIVAQAPDILWLRDTDADGVCDKVETLYTGFGDFDAHAVINNFRWGQDGWIYSAIGYSAGNPVSGTNGESFGRVTAGVIRFQPDGSAVEQVSSGSCNTWGFDFAPDGEMFFTTATCGQHFLHIVMPEKFLAKGNVGGVRAFNVTPDHQDVHLAREYKRPAYVQIDWVGGFTAASGCCMYNGGAWPEVYDGSHFVSETTVNLLHHELLTPQGVSYVARHQEGRQVTEFLRGTDLWFRPVHQRIGPDGALYLVDFYNQAAIHNDTRGPKHGAHNAATRPDRDHKFARIYRIQHKQARKWDIPNLANAKANQLVNALKHSNGWVRDTAARLLRERNALDQVSPLEVVVKDISQQAFGRITALNTLEALGGLSRQMLGFVMNDEDPVLRRNGLRIAYDGDHSNFNPPTDRVRERINDIDARARLNALLALSTFELTPEIANEVTISWSLYDDPWTQSAALVVADRDPLVFLHSVFQVGSVPEHVDLAGHVARMIAEVQDSELATQLVEGISKQSPSQDGLSVAALTALSASLRENVQPDWTIGLRQALRKLASSYEPALVNATLPLIARWDIQGDLTDTLKPSIEQLKQGLNDPEVVAEKRVTMAKTLLGIRRYDESIVKAVGGLLESDFNINSKADVIDALGSVSDAGAGQELVAYFANLAPQLKSLAFGHLIKRVDWSLILLDAVEKETIALHALGPGNVHQLKAHANSNVAQRALEIVETLRGPDVRERNQLIAEFVDVVQQPGNIEKGKEIFDVNCGICHKFKGMGTDLAPDLTGMGVHGPLDLLMHIIDPNRVVEPNYITTSVETEDDQVIDGVIQGENQKVLTLRNTVGTFEIRKDNILSRRSTGISLMPNGYEALEGEGLRDLIGYLCADENKYRVIDLSGAFTADSSNGIYDSRESRRETLRFKRFGLVRVDGIPFDIVNPVKSPTGNNVIVLKGGTGFAKTLPQSVTSEVGVTASRIHVLGGVGGWAWPYGGNSSKDIAVSKMVLHFVDGITEEKVFRNGVEFADYNSRAEAPGSKEAVELVRYGQVRWLSVNVNHTAVIESITLESYDNQVAPTYVALTVEPR